MQKSVSIREAYLTEFFSTSPKSSGRRKRLRRKITFKKLRTQKKQSIQTDYQKVISAIDNSDHIVVSNIYDPSVEHRKYYPNKNQLTRITPGILPKLCPKKEDATVYLKPPLVHETIKTSASSISPIIQPDEKKKKLVQLLMSGLHKNGENYKLPMSNENTTNEKIESSRSCINFTYHMKPQGFINSFIEQKRKFFSSKKKMYGRMSCPSSILFPEYHSQDTFFKRSLSETTVSSSLTRTGSLDLFKSTNYKSSLDQESISNHFIQAKHSYNRSKTESFRDLTKKDTVETKTNLSSLSGSELKTLILHSTETRLPPRELKLSTSESNCGLETKNDTDDEYENLNSHSKSVWVSFVKKMKKSTENVESPLLFPQLSQPFKTVIDGFKLTMSDNTTVQLASPKSSCNIKTSNDDYVEDDNEPSPRVGYKLSASSIPGGPIGPRSLIKRYTKHTRLPELSGEGGRIIRRRLFHVRRERALRKRATAFFGLFKTFETTTFGHETEEQTALENPVFDPLNSVTKLSNILFGSNSPSGGAEHSLRRISACSSGTNQSETSLIHICASPPYCFMNSSAASIDIETEAPIDILSKALDQSSDTDYIEPQFSLSPTPSISMLHPLASLFPTSWAFSFKSSIDSHNEDTPAEPDTSSYVKDPVSYEAYSTNDALTEQLSSLPLFSMLPPVSM